MRFRIATVIAVVAALSCWQAHHPAAAQRTDENALKSARDAFGTTIGTETIGLYSPSSARGFSPVRAGNLRLEGLYLDVRGGGGGGQVRLSARLLAQNTIHVGLSAQSYPFPSPSGIADYSIRIPGDQYAVSSVFRLVYPESEAVELDAQIPVTETFSLGVGLGAEHTANDFAVKFKSLDGALIGKWDINDSVQLMPFYSRTRSFDNLWGPFLFAAGSALPPKYDRNTSLTQDWAHLNNDDATFGAIAKSRWDGWILNAGLFRSVSKRLGEQSAQLQFRNIQPNGNAEVWAVRIASEGSLPNTSTSGEVRLARPFIEGPRQHTFYLNARGKQVENGFSGNITRRIGSGNILTPVKLPEPAFDAGIRGREYVKQYSGGVSYQVAWQNIGELSAGIQRTRYSRYTRFVDPTPPSTAYQWLYNGTLAAYLSDRLVLYAGYTRGLEDSPRAPPIASNSGVTAAPTLSQQVDGGFRYTLLPGVTLVGGVFQVKKPFFELDKNNYFGRLGDVTHRGTEVSLSGSPLPGLNVVTGMIWIDPRLSGPLVDNGTLGKHPPETVPVTALFSAQYGPANWRGLSVDTRINYAGAYPADGLNTFDSPALTTVDLGMRYRFKAGRTPALIRAQVQNVFNVWKWGFQGTQLQIRPNPQRKFTLQLTLDY